MKRLFSSILLFHTKLFITSNGLTAECLSLHDTLCQRHRGKPMSRRREGQEDKQQYKRREEIHNEACGPLLNCASKTHEWLNYQSNSCLPIITLLKKIWYLELLHYITLLH